MHQPKDSAPVLDLTFPHEWQATILSRRPLIAPPRHYVYPREVEEVERGALELLIRPTPNDPEFLATFALGFADPAVPTGVWSCPNPQWLCAVAGGYAYLVNTADPQQWEHSRVSSGSRGRSDSVTAVVTFYRTPVVNSLRRQRKGVADEPPLLGRRQDSRGPRSEPHRIRLGPNGRQRIRVRSEPQERRAQATRLSDHQLPAFSDSTL